MAITSSSNMNVIMAETRVVAADEDLASWNVIDEFPAVWGALITDDALDFVASIGPFSMDLTDIKGYCYDSYEANGQYYCKYAMLYYYDGWATGLYFYLMTPADAYTNNSLFYSASYHFYFCFNNESCMGGEFQLDAVNSVAHAWVYCGQAGEVITASTTTF